MAKLEKINKTENKLFFFHSKKEENSSCPPT